MQLVQVDVVRAQALQAVLDGAACVLRFGSARTQLVEWDAKLGRNDDRAAAVSERPPQKLLAPRPAVDVRRRLSRPNSWVPQLPEPREVPVAHLDVTTFRVPGAAALGRDRVVEVRGAYLAEAAPEGVLCVVTDDAAPPLSAGG